MKGIIMNLGKLLSAYVAVVLLLFPLSSRESTPGSLSYIQADQLQAAGLDGSGIKVGVISDGVQGLASLQSAGVLPSNIPVVNNYLGTGGEGEAMLQVIHQIAPKASLYFCAPVRGGAGSPAKAAPTATCATELVSNYNVNIIADDIGGNFVFAPTQDTMQTEALLNANTGVLALYAAGNAAQGFYEGPFTPVSLTIKAGVVTTAGTYQVQDFGAASGGSSDPYETVKVPAGATVSECWATSETPAPDAEDAAPGTDNEMTAWILDTSGNVLSSANTTGTNGCGFPSWTNSGSTTATVHLVLGIGTKNNTNAFNVIVSATTGICLCSSGFSMNYVTVGGTADVMASVSRIVSVGASGVDTNTMEAYSQIGPAKVYYSASQTGTNVDGYPTYSYTKLSSPAVEDQPVLTGEDAIPITADPTYFNDSTFAGTSAAVPSIAGVAALLMQAGFSRDQVLSALEATAKPLVGSQSADTWNGNDGFGLIQGYDALLNGGVSIPQPAISMPAKSQTITAGDSVSFSGDCSVTGPATIASYSWSFGDGRTASSKNPGATSFSKVGDYDVTFDCTDSQGLTNPTPASVHVTVKAASSGGGGGGGGSGGGQGQSGGGGGSEGIAEISLLALLLLIGRRVAR
jgi:hypothetical protein